MLLEPEAGAGLWPKVKAKTGWIESNEDTIRLLAGDWRTADGHFQKAAGHNLGALNAAWADPTSGQYTGQVSTGLAHTAEQGSGMSALAQRVDAFAETVTGVKENIRATIALNDPLYGMIGMLLPGPIGGAAQNLFADQVAQMVDTTIDTAANNISGQTPLTFQQPLPPLTGPPPGVKPKDWWAGLTPDDKRRYINERPDLVAGLDGIPTEARDDASRILLDREIARIDQKLAELRADTDYPPSEPAQLEGQLAERHEELVNLRDKLGNNTLYDPEALVPGNDQKFYLLGFDPADDGRAIVARGNPDVAENVATLVPGILNDITTVANEETTADPNNQTLLERLDALHGSATEAGSPSTSVIGWLDYDAPENLGTFNSAAADEARGDLTAFQQGLRDSHVGPRSHNTIIGHSYGSFVAGVAAREGDLMVDDFVTVGSLGTGTQHASELNVPNVWVTENDSDWTADLGVHGRDPSDIRFEAKVFESDPDPSVTLPSGAHSGAFDNVQGNVGLQNLGRIIAAEPGIPDTYPSELDREPVPRGLVGSPRFPRGRESSYDYDPP